MVEIIVSVGHLLRAASRYGNAELALNRERLEGSDASIAAAQEELDNARTVLDSVHELLNRPDTVLSLPNLRTLI